MSRAPYNVAMLIGGALEWWGGLVKLIVVGWQDEPPYGRRD